MHHSPLSLWCKCCCNQQKNTYKEENTKDDCNQGSGAFHEESCKVELLEVLDDWIGHCAKSVRGEMEQQIWMKHSQACEG
mmetsp:Transcript_7916/g.29545  ORF Transcript_7916/g.29545 Transcript_7916/m.29545 type:complete len:80 (+) Transcript_7916:796-1035(+)